MTLPQAIVQFMGVFFLLGVIWKLLSKAKLLPFALYLIGVNNVYPVWVAEHQLAYYGIMALCLLYPISYWLLRYRRHRQEEAEAMASLLAEAGAYQYDARYQRMQEMIQRMDERERRAE